MPDTHVVRVASRLNFWDIRRVVGNFTPVAVAGGQDRGMRVEVDLRRLCFASPGPLAVLATGIRSLAHSGANVTIRRPSDEDCHEYLIRFDFYSRLGIDLPYRWTRRDPTGRFLALAEVDAEDRCHDAAKALTEIVRRQAPGLDEAGERSVFIAIVEVLDNVFQHARSEVPPIVCAQFYTDGRIEMAITDAGIGFAESLRRNPAHRLKIYSDTAAIELGIQRGVTANPDGGNSGEGLFFARELVRDNSGAMVIHSGTGRLSIRGSIQSISVADAWQGAIVALSLRTDRPLDPTMVYNRYAPPEDEYDLFPEEGNERVRE